MFTVVICDEHIINDCHNKYYIYFKPFLDNEEFTFCKWNTAGNSLDEAVPELKDIIGQKSEWRAVIVNDSSTWDFDAVNKRNPFDYADSKKQVCEFSNRTQISEYRNAEEKMTEKALTNPLTRLSVWLCGSPIETEPAVCYAGKEDVIEDSEREKEYFDAAKELNVTAEEIEFDRARMQRFKKLSKVFGNDAELFNPPKTVLALSERTKDISREVAASAWVNHMEFDYSQFYNENLYPGKLRYILCDVSYLKGVHNESQYFNFLTTILILATNECPNGTFRANRVYSLDIKIDSECVRELCNRYNSKLKATLVKIDNESKKLKERASQPIDRDTAEFYFETGVTVPVNIDRYFEEEDLKARYNSLGLAKDCPQDEQIYWNEQYKDIEKKFIKYLREPRNAVKIAAKDKFPAMNNNNDERALQLNEFQRENVLDFLNEEEQNMISTKTTHLYITAEYKKEMEKADKAIRKSIGERMTKKKTLVVALTAVLAYLMGFLPLFFGSFNNTGSFAFSFGMTGITIGIFVVIGIIALFVFKHKLAGKFRDFNDVMDSILTEIQNGLNAFSEYLSSACNVMRGFSVLEKKENSYERQQNILKNHKRIILGKIKEVNELFSDYIENDVKNTNGIYEPYDFDFTKMIDYCYEMPYSEVKKTIAYMQEENEIKVPVDYLESIIAEREELYD